MTKSILAFLQRTADNRIVKAAQEMFSKWCKGDKSAVHPDLRSAVFGIALKNGGKEEVLSILTPPADRDCLFAGRAIVLIGNGY